MPIIGSAAGASLRSLGFFGGKAIITGGPTTVRTEYSTFVVYSFPSTEPLVVKGGPVTGDFLLVGGGEPGEPGKVNGAGGYKGSVWYYSRGGTGGRAGVVSQNPNATLASGSYTVTVGAASGASSISNPTTTFFTAAGGPGNTTYSPGTVAPGPDVVMYNGAGGAGSGGSGVPFVQESPTAPPTGNPGSLGGIGVSNSWRTGSAQTYGGGGTGGGASNNTAVPSSRDGGGVGGYDSAAPAPVTTPVAGGAGAANTGSGGGGGYGLAEPATIPVGGAGGTGIVVLRFPKATVQ